MARRAVDVQVRAGAQVERDAGVKGVGQAGQGGQVGWQLRGEKALLGEGVQLVLLCTRVDLGRLDAEDMARALGVADRAVWARGKVVLLQEKAYWILRVVNHIYSGRAVGEQKGVGAGFVPLIAISVPTMPALEEEARFNDASAGWVAAHQVEVKVLDQEGLVGKAPRAAVGKVNALAGRQANKPRFGRAVGPKRRVDLVWDYAGRRGLRR